MYTFSLTAHWGTRLWSGGELYFNPEIVSGVPFTENLIGLGGFTNGEITRAAGTTPQAYRQRLFCAKLGIEEVAPRRLNLISTKWQEPSTRIALY